MSLRLLESTQAALASAGTDAFASVVSTQAALLLGLTTGAPRSTRLRHPFLRQLRQNPSLVEAYVAVLRASTGADKPPPELCVLAGHLAAFCASAPACESSRAACNSVALELYSKVALGGGGSLRAATLACRTLLSLLTADQFAASLLPALQRALKRNPETAAAAAAGMLAELRLDCEPFAHDLLPPLLSAARSAKEETRACGAQAVAALVRHSSQAAERAVGLIRALLSGSAEGRLKDITARTGLLAALEGVARAPGAPAMSGDVCLFLVSHYKTDIQEDVRLATISALAQWLAAHAALPAEVLELACGGLKEKETLRRGHLRMLLATPAAAMAAITGSLLELVLQQLARGAVAKPAQRWEGLAALTLLLRAEAAQLPSGGAAAEADKLWMAVLGAGSALLRAPAVARLGSQDALVGVELAGMLLCSGKSGRLAPPDALNMVAQLLTLLQLCPHRTVAVAASRAVEQVMASTAPAATHRSLRCALSGWLALAEEQGGLYQLDEGGEWAGIARNTAARAVVALASSAAAALPEFLLLSCSGVCQGHGTVAERTQRSCRLWSLVTACAERAAPGCVTALFCKERAGSLVDALLGAGGLLAPGKKKEAALAALRVLAASSPGFAFQHLLPPLLALADGAEHNAFTPADIAIYFAPEGLLVDEFVKQNAAHPAVSDTRRKSRGRKKLGDDDSDDEGALPTAAPAKAAPGKPGKEDPREVARQQRLALESSVRRRVELARNSLESALAGLRALAEGNAAAAHSYLGSLAPPVLSLLASPLVGGGAAFYAIRGFAGCCVWPPGHSLSAETLATALHLCTAPATGVTALSSAPSIQRSVQLLAAMCEQEPLDPQTYTLCFPIICRLLETHQATALHPDSFRILAAHANPDVEAYPFRASLELLFSMLEAGPLPSGAGQSVGLSQASAMDAQQPWSLLLNNCCVALSRRTESDMVLVFDGLLSASPQARLAALRILPSLPIVSSGVAAERLPLVARLFLALHDPVEDNAGVAAHVWSLCRAELPDGLAAELLPFLASNSAEVRKAASLALAKAMHEIPKMVQPTLAKLFGFYSDSTLPAARAACLDVLQCAAEELTARDLPLVVMFIIRVLSDEDEAVRGAATAAGTAVVNAHGEANTAVLQQIFENFLNQQSAKDADEAQRDQVRAGVVVLMGALGKHLPKADPKIQSIVNRLIDTLSTPSETVQRSVSDCLPGLVPALSEEERQALVARLQKQLTSGKTYGERRGAAFGLAGAVKGLGISALKAFGIMDALKASVEDKGSALAREGALLAFECLCMRLGRLFEPYVIHILPVLLSCFGDSSAGVREATEGAANAIMGQLSGQGVKLVLPGLLKGLEDSQWRTKQGSVQLLGSMAFCAPKQLTACLPAIVPRLADTLTDTHPKVAGAARAALHVVGSVIRNPEISALVPCILEAITDPNEKTNGCLDVLLETTFVNSIDAPSLALLVPVITRGLRERKTDLKKKAAKIVGNMCALVGSSADLAPYVSLILPELKRALVDPIPEVRSIAAKALASLLQGMGEAHFVDLVPWLLQTLQSDTSNVERSGAAQGLAEVLAVLGSSHLDAIMPDVVAGCSSPRAAMREGYLTLLRFAPATLGQVFEPQLPAALPCILSGLSDEAEGVRDAAMGAGRIVVERYARSALPLLLPPLLKGYVADSWRIRQSSVELMGDLLFRLAGTSGKVQTSAGDDDEGISTEAQGRLLLEALGEERRADVLAATYIARSDVGLLVRNAALHTWKTLVVNTPRTLGEILPHLMQRIISALAAEGSDQRTTASRCLGDLVKKLADRVLPSIIPILQAGLSNPDSNSRQGVCLGISEVLESASRVQLASHYSRLIPAVQQALCDDSPSVRVAAGAAFNQLFKGGGGSDVLSEIVPTLITSLEGDDANALEGLKQVLKAQPRLLSSVLPRLSSSPISASCARAIGAIADVAGDALLSFLPTVFPPLLEACTSTDDEVLAAARAAAQAVMLTADEENAYMVVAELLRGMEDKDDNCRAISARLAGLYVQESPVSLASSLPTIIGALVAQLADACAEVVQAAWTALGEVTAKIPKEELHTYVRCMRDAVSSAREKERRRARSDVDATVLVSGFCLPKGLAPVINVYLQGLLTGSAEARCNAGEGLAELISVTSEESLKPHVVAIAGPLIRVVSDKFSSAVKASILQALDMLMLKGGAMLKAFVPQLQTSCVRCLQDPGRSVRARAVDALGRLMKLQSRVDPLLTELLNSLASSPDSSYVETTVLAVSTVVGAAGANVSPPVLLRVVDELKTSMVTPSDDVVAACSAALGVVSSFLHSEAWASLWAFVIAPAAAELRVGRSAALSSLLDASGDRAADIAGALPSLQACLSALVADDRAVVREHACRACGAWLLRTPATPALKEMLLVTMKDESSAVRRRAVEVVGLVVRRLDASTGAAFLAPPLLPAVVDAVHDSAATVKAASQRALRRCINAGVDLLATGGPAVRRVLTDAVLRRITADGDDSD